MRTRQPTLTRSGRSFRSVRWLSLAGAIAASSCGGSGSQRTEPASEKAGRVGQQITATPPTVTPLATVASQVIGTVPGGGGVRSSGAFVYDIPIAVPRGRAGMEPKLSLSYSSHFGNGRLGVGWSIAGLSRIVRCRQTFATGVNPAGRNNARPTDTIRFDGSDEFCLDGQKLLLVSGTGNYGTQGSEYRTEVDTFQKITLTTVGPTGPNVWTVLRKDGTIAVYRNHTNPFRETLNLDGSLATRVHTSLAFPLREERDRAGNEISYDYGTEAVPRILEIRYSQCNAVGNCAPYTHLPLRKVTFEYDTDPNPPPGEYINGVFSASTARLRNVKTWDLTRTSAGDLVRDYRLDYVTSAISGRNLLKSVTIADGAGVVLPATTFRWHGETSSSPEYRVQNATLTAYTDPLVLPPMGPPLAISTALEHTFAVLDANGDGNDDVILKTWAGPVNGAILGPNGRATSSVEPRDYLFLGRGDGRLSAPVPLDPEGNGQPAAGTTCQQAEIIDLGGSTPIDLDMNGAQELVAPMNSGCPFQLDPVCALGTSCDARITTRYEADGNLSEATRKYAVLRWDAALGTLRSQTLAPISDTSWVGDRVMFADVTGDALPDLFRTRRAAGPTWLEYQAKSIAPTNPVAVQYTGAADTFLNVALLQAGTFKPEDIHSVLDEDGDGRQELVRAQWGVHRSYSRDPDTWREWRVVNENTNATATTLEGVNVFQPGPAWSAPDGTTQPTQRVVVDVNGDGLRDYLIPVVATGEFMLRVNTGAGYTAPTRLSTDPAVISALRPYVVAGDEGGRAARSGLIATDWDGDGRDDLLLLGSTATTGATLIPLPSGANSDMFTRTESIQVLYARQSGYLAPREIPTGGLNRIFSTYSGWSTVKLAELDGNALPELVMFVREGSTGSVRRMVVLGRADNLADEWPAADVINFVDDARGPSAEEVRYDSMSRGTSRRLEESADTHASDTFGTEFEPGTDPPVALHLPCAYPARCIARGTVVYRYTNNRTTRRIRNQYGYAGGRTDVTGRGSLGFRRCSVRDLITQEINESRFWPVISHGDSDPLRANYHAYPRLAQAYSVKRKIPFGASVLPGLSAVGDAPLAIKSEWSPSFSSGRPIQMASSSTKLRTYEEVGHLGQPPPASQERERVRTETQVTYDTLGNETNRVTSNFDVSLNVTTETLLEKITTTTTYQNVVSAWHISMPNRRTTTFQTIEAPYNGCTTFPCDTETQITDFVFDAEGMLKDVIREPTGDASLKLTTTYGRDAAGLIRSVTVKDSTGSSATTQRVTETDYDAFGHHPRVTKNAEGHLDWFLYDQRLDRLLVQTDPNGVSVYSQYDGFGRLRETRDDRGPVTRVSYGSDFVRTENVGGAKRTQFFDPAGRLELSVWTTLTGSGVSRSTYDPLGNVAESRYIGSTTAYDSAAASAAVARGIVTAAGSIVTHSASYDLRGRPVSLRHGTDLPVVTAYKGLGETWVTQDSGIVAQQRKTYFSGTGRAREVQDRLAGMSGAPERWLSTRYEYDALGLLALVTDPKNQSEQFNYDRLGRRTSWLRAATKTPLTEWSYSAFDDVTRRRDGVNDVSATYDRLARLDRRLRPDNSVISNLDWDQGAFAIGKISRAQGPTGHDISYTYDSKGRSLGETHGIGPARLSMSRTYDANGRLDVLQYPETASTDNPLRARSAGLRVKYAYANGQTSQIQDVTDAAAPLLLWTVDERHPLGMLQKGTEGVRSTILTYKNDTLRLESVSRTGFMNGTLPNVRLAYGPTGMLQSRTSMNNVIETFDHDTLRRLWRYQRIGSNVPLRLAGVEYSYDDAGNMTRADATQSHESVDFPLVDYDYLYSPTFPNRLSQLRVSATQIRELRYDAAGRQTEDQPNTSSPAFRKISYNHDDLPTRIEAMLNATTPDSSQTATTFDYDAYGKRVRKTRGPDITLHVNGLYTRTDLSSMFVVTSEDGPILELRRTTSGARSPNYLYHDHLGSRIANSVVVIGFHWGFFPYGQRWHGGTPSTASYSVGFTGHEHDDDLGLINMQGRMYDPSQSRFLTPDPKPLPGATGGMNPYAYALNSPANNTDPTGYQPCCKDPLIVTGTGDWRASADAAAARAQDAAMRDAQQRAEEQARRAAQADVGARAQIEAEQRARGAQAAADAERWALLNGGRTTTPEEALDFVHTPREPLVLTMNIHAGRLYVSGGGVREYSLPVTTGNGDCMNETSFACRGKFEEGPIVPGKYIIRSEEVSETSGPGHAFVRMAATLGEDWGSIRVPLHPDAITDEAIQRNGRTGHFYIHGGMASRPGSAGCIDCGGGLSGNELTQRLANDMRSAPGGRATVIVVPR